MTSDHTSEFEDRNDIVLFEEVEEESQIQSYVEMSNNLRTEVEDEDEEKVESDSRFLSAYRSSCVEDSFVRLNRDSQGQKNFVRNSRSFEAHE